MHILIYSVLPSCPVRNNPPPRISSTRFTHLHIYSLRDTRYEIRDTPSRSTPHPPRFITHESRATGHESRTDFSLYFRPKIGYNTSKLNIVCYLIPNSELPDTNYDSPPAPYHSPLTIYRLPFHLFVQNKPNLHKPQIYLNLFTCKDLRKNHQILPPKSKPKQTQTKPIRPPFFARYGTPNPKQTQTNPIKPNSSPRSLRRIVPRAEAVYNGGSCDSI
jgi:hypothetical protein